MYLLILFAVNRGFFLYKYFDNSKELDPVPLRDKGQEVEFNKKRKCREKSECY